MKHDGRKAKRTGEFGFVLTALFSFYGGGARGLSNLRTILGIRRPLLLDASLQKLQVIEAIQRVATSLCGNKEDQINKTSKSPLPAPTTYPQYDTILIPYHPQYERLSIIETTVLKKR